MKADSPLVGLKDGDHLSVFQSQRAPEILKVLFVKSLRGVDERERRQKEGDVLNTSEI